MTCFLNPEGTTLLTEANRSHVRVPDVEGGWDGGDAADFCTSNEAQVTCHTFRYLLLPSDRRASVTRALGVKEPPHAEPVPIAQTADSI